MLKSATSDQEVPSYSSVLSEALPVVPPIAKAAVCIPAPPPSYLAVFKLLPSVQEVPLNSS